MEGTCNAMSFLNFAWVSEWGLVIKVKMAYFVLHNLLNSVTFKTNGYAWVAIQGNAFIKPQKDGAYEVDAQCGI